MMKLICQSVSEPIITTNPELLIETAGRICYKSKEKGEEARNKLIQTLISSGHHSVIEHAHATFMLTTDRGVSHELVRHRLASYSQESTRYCQYSGEVIFIRPVWFRYFGARTYARQIDFSEMTNNKSMEEQIEYDAERLFINHCIETETAYKRILAHGWKAEQARQVLSNALATTIVMTANFREWRHVFKLRCSEAAHPQIRALMLEARDMMIERHPVIFGGLK